MHSASPGGVGPTLFHHRPSREFPPQLDTEPVVVAGPPVVPEARRGLGLQLALPLVGSLSIVGFAFLFRNTLFIFIAAGIAGFSVVITATVAIQQRRSERRRRAKQAVRYRAYLAETGARLAAAAAAQRARLEWLHPDAESAWRIATSRQRLWERRPGDPDFLRLRLGLGAVPLAAPVRLDLGGDPLVEHEPDLLAEAQEIVEAHAELALAPVTAGLSGLGAVAVVGERELSRSLVRHLLCELAALHAPDDLGLVAWFDPEAEDAWSWLKWLPHSRDSSVERDAATAGVALTVDPEDLELLLSQIVRPRASHLERQAADAGSRGPVPFRQIVVVLDGYEPGGAIDALPSVREALVRGRDLGVLMLCLVDAPEDVPSTADARIELFPGGGLSYVGSGPDGLRLEQVLAAGAEPALCESLARTLAPLRLRGGGGRAARVESEGLLDLIALEAADAPLQTPLGVGDDGEPLVLDLRQQAEGGMGPHGLVVGATGSGKSELLRTLVAGLALRHDTEELAFVFVDFKGNATFAELAGLPHLAGLITSLESDPLLIERTLEALRGELERRQRLLDEAGGLADVRAYHRARAERPELPPLPSLLVVVDEFGELLAQQPDFLDFFVTAGRLGRSLGVHLLLATQRLDEGRIRGLESHLRYRICLKTLSPEESMIALGRRDAFELPPLPGLAFLQVDGALRRFKTAYVGRPHRVRRPVAAAEHVVAAFGVRGLGEQPEHETADEASEPEQDSAGTELQVAVERSRAAARNGSLPSQQVWLPPLTESVELGELVDPGAPLVSPGDQGWLQVRVGIVDLPRAQQQLPLALDFGGTGGHLAVVGAPRSGKSTLLQTLVASLALTHDPASLHVYAIDFGGGGLHALAQLPHVGAVYGRGDREHVDRLVRELQAIVAERTVLFRRERIDGVEGYHAARAAGRLPEARHGEVFLVVDNWALLGQEHEQLERSLAELVASGLHYGVHVVLSANRWNDLRLAVRDNVGGRLELRLNDPLESEIDRRVAKTIPDIPGRGIARGGRHFQAALPLLDGSVEAVVDAPRARAAKRAGAPAVPLLPALVSAADLPDQATDPEPGVAIGLDEHGLRPARVDVLGSDTHLLVFGDAESGKTSLLRGLGQRLAATAPPDELRIAVVDYRRQLLDALPASHLYEHACTPEQTAAIAAALRAQVDERRADESWSGPELVLLVDDYDLVAGAAENPLAPLVDALLHGRDVGFHAVVARRISGLQRVSFEPFLMRLRELGPAAVVLSGDPQEGIVIGDVRASQLPEGRGWLVRRRRAVLIQTLFTPPVEPQNGGTRTSTRSEVVR